MADCVSRLLPIHHIALRKPDLEWDKRVIQDAQDEDPFTRDIKGKILQEIEVKDFMLDADDILWKRVKLNGGKMFVVFVPRKLRTRVMELYHDTLWSGHRGAEAMHATMRRTYTWDTMMSDLRKFVKSCHLCNTHKENKSLKVEKLRPFKRDQSVMTHVHIDLVGKISPPGSSGEKYLLTVICAFTRYLEVFPLHDMTAFSVAHAFVHGWILRHSCPVCIVSDLGRQFVSEVWQEVCAILKIKHTHTTAHHQQSNGRLERQHGTIKQMLRLTIDNKPQTWLENLKFVIFAYNTTPKKVLGGLSPFECLFGREPCFPLDITTNPAYTRVFYNEDENVKSMLIKRMRDAHEIARAASDREEEITARQYNKKSREKLLSEGQIVYLRDENSVPHVSHGLQKLYTGPYRVMGIPEDHSSGANVIIQNIDSDKQQVVHKNRVKPALSRCELDNDVTPSEQSDTHNTLAQRVCVNSTREEIDPLTTESESLDREAAAHLASSLINMLPTDKHISESPPTTPQRENTSTPAVSPLRATAPSRAPSSPQSTHQSPPQSQPPVHDVAPHTYALRSRAAEVELHPPYSGRI
jgi:transposase InsO family protein